jgi:hypothetical protein
MTREDDFIGQLEGYLDEYEGLTPLPYAVRDAVQAELPMTRQIGALPGPIRYLRMSTAMPAPAKYGLAAALVAVAALLGATFFSRGGNIGGGPTATPTPTATLAPTSAVLIDPDAVEALDPLAAGTYYVDTPFPVPVTFDLPEGWRVWVYSSAGSQVNLNPARGGSGEVSFEIVDNIAADPCTTELIKPPVGPSVGDLVAALSNMEGFAATPATAITVDGYQGKQFTLTAPDADAACQSMLTWKTTTRQNGVGPGEINEVRIFDVGGVRLLICIAYTPPIAAEELSELQAVVDSVRFGR